MKPKEDPEDRKARLRERRLTDIERARALQENAADLTSELRAIYGLRKNIPATPAQPAMPAQGRRPTAPR
jgi:hypothetical protein